MFCFFPDIHDVDAAAPFAATVPRLVRTYLLHVRDDKALAAWMAGDLLGDHWDKADGLRVLVDVLHRARFVAGRQAALHGMRMLVEESTRAQKAAILKALNRAAATDRSRRVRLSALSLIDELKT